MTKNTTYLSTPYPETTDIADVPKNLRDIALSWENSFGGAWPTWTPVVTQSNTGANAVVNLDPATTIAKVRKIGKTVYVLGHLVVLTNPSALGGAPDVQLPYPLVSKEQIAGVCGIKAGSTWGEAVVRCPTGGGIHTDDTAWVTINGGAGGSMVAGDVIALLLRYDTV